MDKLQNRFENEARDFLGGARANRIKAVQLADQINMDGVHVKNGRAGLRVPLGLQLHAETVICLLLRSKIDERRISSADFITCDHHNAVSMAFKGFEMNSVNAILEHQSACPANCVLRLSHLTLA
ncbi:MAG TPA: hypothetical protein VJV58_18160 [Bradyrhizobium sp.]|nr:hypothetical protein [Bradyrhizobium sp.]